jgi:CRISPR-associated protein Cas1
MSRRYYINNSGRLKRKENTIFFEISEKERKIIPINDIDSIYIFGEVDLNTKVLSLKLLSTKRYSCSYI